MSQIKLGLLLATLQIICHGFISYSTSAAADARLAVPDAAACAAALKVVRESFAGDFHAAKTAADRSALAKKILQTADDSKAVPADCYVLMDLARTTAVNAADADTALQAVDHMKSAFEVDDVKLGADTLTELVAARFVPEDHFYAAAEAVVVQAVHADRYQMADTIAKLALKEAKRARTLPVIKHWIALYSQVDALRTAFQEVPQALKILEQKPDDPAANLTVGKFKCLEKGEWTIGLPRLARGDDAELRDLAKRDLKGSGDPKEQLSLGDAWWDLAAKGGRSAGQMQQRAAFWYRQAVPGLTGLLRIKAEHRITECPPLSNLLEASADTVYLTDLPEVSVSTFHDGYWGFGKHGRITDSDDKTMIHVNGDLSPHGLGLHAPSNGTSVVVYALGGKFSQFDGAVAIDDGVGGSRTPITFRINGDDKELWRGKPVSKSKDVQRFSIDVHGVDKLEIMEDCPGEHDGAHAVWVEPRLLPK